MTQVGTSNPVEETLPFATSARVITPIVFWASLVPCASASRPPESDLAEPEAARHRPGSLAADDPVGDDDPDRADDEGEHRGDHRRDQHLADDPVAEDRVGAGGDERRADDAADQRVRGARRGSPKYQVIRFQAIAPDEAGEDHRRRDRAGVDDVLGDRRRDLERDEGAGEVEHRRVRRPRSAATSRGSRSRSRRRWPCRGSRS